MLGQQFMCGRRVISREKPQAEWGHLARHHPETGLRELGVGFGCFVNVFVSVGSGR